MDFQIKVLLLSFSITTFISIIIIPLLTKLKIGQVERIEGPKTHIKKEGTPTMGGLAVIISIIIVTMGMYFYYAQKEEAVSSKMIPLIISTIGFGLIGFIDDFKKVVFKDTKGLSPKYKMLGLLLISALYIVYITYILNIGTETYIPFLKQYIEIPIYIYIPSAIFIILGTTNAVNLTDGIDGLSASVTTIIITCLTVIGTILDMKEITLFGTIVVGCCLGFLLFNLNPARIFMGDTGSLLLGGAMVTMTLYMQMPLILVIIALIPIIETISVILQVIYYKKTGNRIFKMTPIHHHFELCGWKENKIVTVFALITLVLSIIGILSI